MKERLTLKDIKIARDRIGEYVYKTPLEKSLYLSRENKNVYMKLECMQSVKAFKIRGALNKILSLSDEERAKGIVTTSSGNHGISVSFGAKLAGVEKALVIVPQNTPQSKLDKIAYFGGEIMKVGVNYDEANAIGQKYISEHDLTFIDGWDNDEMVYAGQGTVGLEILEQKPEIDTVLVPIGGGGLATGVAVAVKGLNPNIKVIGVQTKACPAYVASIRDNVLYNQYPTEPSICEALVGGVGQLAFEMQSYIDEVLIVEEDYIKEAIAHMVYKEKTVVEPSGAITIAAIIQHFNKIEGKNIAAVISGANIDENLMLNILNDYKK